MGKPADGTWRYSGGGYTLLQLLIEEVSGEDFATYMQHGVLEPLGMHHSTFSKDDLDSRVAAKKAEAPELDDKALELDE